MPGPQEIGRSRVGIEQLFDRGRAVVRRDSGGRQPARFDRNRKGRFVQRRYSRCTICGICSSSSRRPGSGTQIRPPASLRMKLIASGVTICGGHHQVALVLAILVVEHDDHLARANVGDRLLDRIEGTGIVAQLVG